MSQVKPPPVEPDRHSRWLQQLHKDLEGVEAKLGMLVFLVWLWTIFKVLAFLAGILAEASQY